MKRLLSIAFPILVLSHPALSTTWHIQPDGSGDAPTIQAGIDSAAAEDTVLVTCGTYEEFDLYMKSRVVLLGETGNPSCVTVDAGGSGRIGRCIDTEEGTLIRGFTFTGGDAQTGGGFLCYETAIRFQNCAFVGNVAGADAGALSCQNSEIEIIECSFSWNSCAYSGGAIQSGDSDLVLSACIFTDNSAGYWGGAIYTNGQTASLTDCQFLYNSAMNRGKAMYLVVTAAVFDGCNFFANTGDGSALFVLNGWTTIGRSSFSGNDAGVRVDGFSSNRYLDISNTIIAHSTMGQAVNMVAFNVSSTIICSDFYGNSGGDWTGRIAWLEEINGNLTMDPFFCEPDFGNLTLRSDSPCLPGNHPDGYDCGLIGAFGEGCSAPTSVPAGRFEPASWGSVKSLFR